MELFQENLYSFTKYIFSLLIFICAMPIVIILLICFFNYRLVIILYLKIKYGKDFGGLLNGCDALFANEDNVINILMIIESEEPYEQFHQYLKTITYEKCFQDTTSKFCAIRKQLFGFHFLLNDKYKIDDCIRTIKTETPNNSSLSEKELQNIISSKSNKSLPKNNSALWQIIFFDKSLHSNNNKNDYAVYMRIHHCLGDGISLMIFFMQAFSSDSQNNIMEYFTNKFQKKHELTLEAIKTSVKHFLVMIIKVPVILRNMFGRVEDKHFLHAKSLSGDKILTWSVEEQMENCIHKIKEIKSKIIGATFSEVVLTAISASFSEFFEKKSKKLPEVNYLTSFMPVAFINTADSGIRMLSNNNFSSITFRIPILFTNECCLINRLKKIQAEKRLVECSGEYLFNYWLIKVIPSLLPSKLLKFLFNFIYNGTAAISILPGTSKLQMSEGNDIKDVIFWLANSENVGITLSILTYDNHFQIGLTVDKVLISKKEDAQSIVNAIFKYINELHSAVHS